MAWHGSAIGKTPPADMCVFSIHAGTKRHICRMCCHALGTVQTKGKQQTCTLKGREAGDISNPTRLARQGKLMPFWKAPPPVRVRAAALRPSPRRLRWPDRRRPRRRCRRPRAAARGGRRRHRRRPTCGGCQVGVRRRQHSFAALGRRDRPPGRCANRGADLCSVASHDVAGAGLV